MALAFLYPGQGSQRTGMLHRLPADAEIGDWEQLDSEDALASTTGAQLALLVAGVGASRLLMEGHGLVPDFVAGHSAGAFAAAVSAGVLTLPEAIEAVRLRGELMARACLDGDWGMAALVGIRPSAARALVQDVSSADDPLWIANVNAADQVVLGGTGRALAAAGQAARHAGARRCERLPVAVASHGPIQAETAERLATHLGAIPRRRQRIPYLTNTRGRRILDDSDAVLDDLAQAVAHPVRWHDAIRLMVELGMTTAVEMPPGQVLTRLLAGTAPAVRGIPFDGTSTEVLARRIRQSATWNPGRPPDPDLPSRSGPGLGWARLVRTRESHG